MRQALLAGATRVGGTAALLPGLGGPSGIAAIGITVPARVLAGGETADGTSAGSGSPAGTVAGATRDGFGFSLGSAPSGSIDGTRDPATSTGATGSIRVGSGVDTDGDGIPDAWESDHGAPVAPAAPTTTGSNPDRRDTTTPSAFTADPPDRAGAGAGTPVDADPGPAGRPDAGPDRPDRDPGADREPDADRARAAGGSRARRPGPVLGPDPAGRSRAAC